MAIARSRLEPALRRLGRGEVDRDPPGRMDVAGVADRASDPFARLLERGVGQPDDREPGQAGRDVHLDADGSTLEAEQRCGRDDGQHAAILAGAGHPRR